MGTEHTGHSHSLLYWSFLTLVPFVFCLVCQIGVGPRWNAGAFEDFRANQWSCQFLEWVLLWAETPRKGCTLLDFDFRRDHGKLHKEINDLKVIKKMIRGDLWLSAARDPVFSFFFMGLFLFGFISLLYKKGKKKLAQPPTKLI